MAEMLLFHHVLGRTHGIGVFADTLREAGHQVHVPDLFDGRTFATIEEGMAYVEKIGFDEVVDRGVQVTHSLPKELVYAGFSLGVAPAQKLAQTRKGTRGALLFHSCVSISRFSPGWPRDVPAQIHAMDADPYFVEEGDLEAARELIASVHRAELFLYPGSQHLFADSSLASYDADATRVLLRRVLNFLQQLDGETNIVIP